MRRNIEARKLRSLGNWRFSWQAITARRRVIIGKYVFLTLIYFKSNP